MYDERKTREMFTKLLAISMAASSFLCWYKRSSINLDFLSLLFLRYSMVWGESENIAFSEAENKAVQANKKRKNIRSKKKPSQSASVSPVCKIPNIK